MQIHEEHIDYVSALEPGEISCPIVMRSAAGWYVGTVQVDPDMGVALPYSRDSGYMSSRDAFAAWEDAFYETTYCEVCGFSYDADTPCQQH